MEPVTWTGPSAVSRSGWLESSDMASSVTPAAAGDWALQHLNTTPGEISTGTLIRLKGSFCALLHQIPTLFICLMAPVGRREGSWKCLVPAWLAAQGCQIQMGFTLLLMCP